MSFNRNYLCKGFQMMDKIKVKIKNIRSSRILQGDIFIKIVDEFVPCGGFHAGNVPHYMALENSNISDPEKEIEFQLITEFLQSIENNY